MKQLAAILLALALAIPATADEKKKKKPKGDKHDVEAIGDRDVDGKVNFYSLDKEVALGKQLADEVARTSKIIRDPFIAEYVNRLGQNIGRNSDAGVPLSFQVVDDPSINAFALPGGFLFVNTGLLLAADTEAELVGVLAHEVAHVAARHGTRQATRGQIANYATIPLMFLGGWAGFGVRQAASMVIPMTFLQFSKGFEREADYLGVQYLYAAGYDPAGFVDFFEKLQAQEKRKPGTISKVFRSHPLTDDRIAAAQEEIGLILPSKPEYRVSSSEFLGVKDRLMLLKRPGKDAPDDSKPRIVRSGGRIDPSGESSPTGIEDDDAPPVLRRGGSTEASPDDEDGPPVLRRGGSEAPSSAPESGVEDPEDDGPPVLRRN